MKIATILGARPQFIKAAAVSREIQRENAQGNAIEEIIIHTGQHYDSNMSDVFFEEMEIPKPDYFLGIGGGTHGAMTGRMIEKIEQILLKEQPDWVMVYGDTNSTLAGAVAASKLHIKIAHVEAGLRSYNIRMPEEINRIITDRVSTVLFCPTLTAEENLKKEGVEQWQNDVKVVLSGDVMQDSAFFYRNLAKKPFSLKVDKGFVLCTIHRAENTDEPTRLENIISALNEIAQTRQVILPLHPRTKNIINMGEYDISNLTIIDPVGYLTMVWLIDHCSLIMTDSGGLQKEAYFFSKPCITMRDETEWLELVQEGVNTLVGADKQKILNAYQGQKSINSELFDLNLYGDGYASSKILKTLLELNDEV